MDVDNNKDDPSTNSAMETEEGGKPKTEYKQGGFKVRKNTRVFFYCHAVKINLFA